MPLQQGGCGNYEFGAIRAEVDPQRIILESVIRDTALVITIVRKVGIQHPIPWGKVVILEFSRPRNRLFRVLYEFYTYKILPRIGGMVSKDKRAYEYLPASVGEFPAPAEFMSMMERAGFRGCRARSQSFGIAQIYTGQR